MRRGDPPTWSSAKAAFCGRANKNASVQIYRYVTEGSFDAYMWQTLETKAKFIAQVMTGDTTMRRHRRH
jgi:SNF2 family DNA or RNA helicase